MNKRIWRGTLTHGSLAQEVYFYGADGQKIGTYTFNLTLQSNNQAEILDFNNPVLAVFFGSKRVGVYDRLGTAKYNQNGAMMSFYPYGEERGTVTANDSLKFATYTRDTATGLDYADQRYYAGNFGRFMSPDRYKATGKGTSDPSAPSSWNRYSYVLGDPINFLDPAGRLWCNPDDICSPDGPPPYYCDDGEGGPQDCGGGGGGSPPPPPPPCWSDLGGAFDTFRDLGLNIAEITTEKLKSANLGREVVQLDLLVAGTVAQEIAETAAAVLTGGPGPDFNGGHFNLFLSSTALQNIFGTDFAQFDNIFGGKLDGTRQGAVFGSAAQLNYTLHSKDQNTQFDFHFDIYNPLSGPVSLVKHFFVEVIGGHSSSPCLDPAWAQ
jgi:RHS repeat-associated protein